MMVSKLSKQTSTNNIGSHWVLYANDIVSQLN